jgi:uncharacterized RDD family membrane protein YckC
MLISTNIMFVGDASKARFIAAFIDNLLAFALMLTVVAAVPEELSVLRAVCIVAGYLGYFFLLEGATGRTVGKYFQGLVVRKLDGSRGTWKEAIIRTLLRIVEVNPALFGGIPAGIILISTERKQRLGDIFAGTVVVPDKLELTPEEVEGSISARTRWRDRIVEEPETINGEDQ